MCEFNNTNVNVNKNEKIHLKKQEAGKINTWQNKNSVQELWLQMFAVICVSKYGFIFPIQK